MKKTDMVEALQKIFSACPENVLTEEKAITPELAGLTIFDPPLVGFAAADDPIFQTYQSPEIIGPWHMTPVEWLPEAASVISMFLPFTEPVRSSNRVERDQPSPQWLHGRIEGQALITAFTRQVRDWLTNQSWEASVPTLDPRFTSCSGGTHPTLPDGSFTSSWSERHAAYACGLGTFGLSKGLITKKGMAGRFCSVITTLELEPDPRPYTGVYENCTRCGACIRRCPAGAISLEKGKDHPLCGELQKAFGKRFAPRYGCGLCQTGVPCEHQIPKPRVKPAIHA